MRRRPLARAAMVGGAAYYGGRRGQQNRDRESEQEARIQELEAQQSAPAYAPPPPPPAPMPAPPPAPAAVTNDTIEQLTKLGQLRDAGVLTDEEFAQQKQKLLG